MKTKFYADHYALRINTVEIESETPSFYFLKGGGSIDKFNPEYFDVWNDAFNALIAEARTRVVKAERELERLRARLAEIETLTHPEISDEESEKARALSYFGHREER